MKCSQCTSPLGKQLANLLRHGWRTSPPEFRLYSPQLLSLLPMMSQGGVLPLLADRIEQLRNIPSRVRHTIGREARYAALQHLRHRQLAKTLVAELRLGGVEPILIKGLSVAQHYAMPLRRTGCDVDLCVPPGQLEPAKQIVASLRIPYGDVDLHAGVSDLKDRGWDRLFDRSRCIDFGGIEIRVLNEEDQLRLVALHFWRHLGCKALWLCDVAALAENRRDAFDWDACFRGPARDRQTVQAVVALAVRLLGADVNETWCQRAVDELPTWVEETVWREWERLGRYSRHACDDTATDRRRFMHPIRASLRMRVGPFHSLRTMQLLALASKPLLLSARLIHAFKRQRPQPVPGRVEVHRDRVF